MLNMSLTRALLAVLGILLVLGGTSSSHSSKEGISKNDQHKHSYKKTASADQHDQVVHVIFMNHLDVGYNGQIAPGFVNFILNRYFREFFPRAALLGEALKNGGYVETFTYTTHPWLVSLYLNCPPNFVLSGIKLHDAHLSSTSNKPPKKYFHFLSQCPGPKALQSFKDAVAAGYIAWHAGPMNMMNEYMPQWLVAASLNISSDVDLKLNVNRKMKVLSQRDVPGMTHAMIPLLLDSGVRAVTVGVNSLTAPPVVPRLFRWSYDNREILAAWHPGGYPNNPGPDPDHPGGLSRKDCLEYPGLRHVLCFAFRTDDTGPPISVREVLDNYEILRKEFPGANITASTLENFFINVLPISDKLPLVTKEIGDTWIQGAASDPRKSAEFRTTARILGDCLQQGKCDRTDRRVSNAVRFLVKLGEHTWGLNTANDTVYWSNQQFSPIRHNQNFENCSKSWVEQRNFTYVAIDALEDHQVAAQIRSGLENLRATRPDLTGYSPVAGDQSCVGSGFRMTVGVEGSITALDFNGSVWVNSTAGQSLAQLLYVTYDAQDFERTDRVYDYRPGVGPGYNKKNITQNAHPESRVWGVTATAGYRHKDSKKCDMWLHLQTVDIAPRKFYGAPIDFWVHYKASTKASNLVVDIEVAWFDKPATRLPEAIFLAFRPRTNCRDNAAKCRWRLSKVGSEVDPRNVVLNGSQYQHGVDDQGITFIDTSQKSLQVTSLDVPVVCPITDKVPIPTPFPIPLQPITDSITGFGFNLYNNIWDTNFIFWYPYLDEDKDFKSRYQIKLS